MSKELENLEVANEVNKVNETSENEAINNENNETEQPQEPQPTYITISELKSKLESGLPINEILNIKKYISFSMKQVLIEQIITSSKQYDDNEILKINYCDLEFFKNFYLIQAYTNFIFNDDNFIDDYDYLMQNKIVYTIYDVIGYMDELEIIDDLKFDFN